MTIDDEKVRVLEAAQPKLLSKCCAGYPSSSSQCQCQGEPPPWRSMECGSCSKLNISTLFTSLQLLLLLYCLGVWETGCPPG